jgi:hypothetical protein
MLSTSMGLRVVPPGSLGPQKPFDVKCTEYLQLQPLSVYSLTAPTDHRDCLPKFRSSPYFSSPLMATMFGALNRFISRLDSDSPTQSSRNGQSASGFQVLRNKNLEIPIEPWYDYVSGINGRQIVDQPPLSLYLDLADIVDRIAPTRISSRLRSGIVLAVMRL